MAPVVSSIVVLALYVILSPRVSGDKCLEYSERSVTQSTVSSFQSTQECLTEFCCDVVEEQSIYSLHQRLFPPTLLVALINRFRQPRPDNTHTTVVTTTLQQYLQQLIAVPGPSQGVPYQSATAQPGFAAQYGYPAQPMSTSPYHGQPFTPGPPPLYLEATGPAYPSQPMPYGQVEFTRGQPAYPLKPLDQQQPNAPPASKAFQAQSAYNLDFVAPPP